MEAIRWVRAGIKLLISVIFLGIVMMWIIYPTNTWSLQWKVAISKATISTYFGKQGVNMLIWTFPVLFIAVLGSLYLHLGNKVLKDNSSERNRKNGFPAAIWKRPVLTRGHLGIVSGVELAFLLMFIALLVWSFSTFLHKSFVKITPKSAAKEGEAVWEVKLEQASLYLGLIGNTCLAFLFFPVARGSSLLPVLGLTSEASIKYHIWIGHITMIIFTAHGIGYITFWASTDQISEMSDWAKTGVSNVAGELSLMAGLVLWATTFPRIRRKMFELFFYTHYMYIPFIFFFILHVGISFAFMMLPGFYLFILDRFLRFLQSRSSIRLLSARLLPHHSGTLELNFSKSPGWDYHPTSMLFINIPAISKLQWHPFTITSSSKLDPLKMSVVIKRGGTWTNKLYQMVSSPSPVDHLNVSVEGPYGPSAATDHAFLKHDMVVMVSGGSGITPFISIIRELIFKSGTTNSENLPQVLLICAFKKSADLAMLDLILPHDSASTGQLDINLQIKAYVTQEEQPPSTASTTYSKPSYVRALWFKQQQTDVPVSPILGHNGWLWLGAIISSSFITFLILIGIITRYYIYPIDHNKNVYSSGGKSVLNMVVLCVCIAGTASGAVLWNKKKYGARASAYNNQVLNMEGMSPTGSSPADHDQYSRSYHDHVEREMESHPRESLVRATQVYFGERPNLTKMLLEVKEGKSSVGVMVCGPKKMRQEVARICSSGLADNLHYESISFSW